jgi:hypothetical protein
MANNVLDALDQDKASQSQTSSPNVLDALNQEHGYSVKPSRPITPEEKPSLIKNIAEDVSMGFIKSGYQSLKMLEPFIEKPGIGLLAVDPQIPPFSKELHEGYQKDVLIPAEQMLKAHDEERLKRKGGMAKDTAESVAEALGYMGGEIPKQVLLGSVAKISLMGKVVSRFVLGSGIEKGIEKLEEGKDPMIPSASSMIFNYMFSTVGGEGKIGETLMQAVKRNVMAIPKMTGVGVAEYISDTLMNGQRPTVDGVKEAGSSGMALAILLSIFPALKDAKEIKNEAKYKKVMDSFQKVLDVHDVERPVLVKLEGSQATIQDAKDAVNDLVASGPEDIGENAAIIVDLVLNHNLETDPRTGEAVDMGKKGEPSPPKSKLQQMLADYNASKPVSKDFDWDSHLLEMREASREQKLYNFLKSLKVKPEDCHRVLEYAENELLHKDTDITLTPEQKKIWETLVLPEMTRRAALIQELRKNGIPVDPDIIPRFLLGKNTVFDRITMGFRKITGNLLRQSTGGMKKREMKIGKGSDGERVVLHIADGKVTAWRNNVPEDLGPYSLAKNIDLLKRDLKPYQAREKSMQQQKRTLESIRLRSPISKARLSNLRQKATDILDFLQRPREKGDPLAEKVAKTFHDNIDAINRKIEQLETKQKTLSDFEGESEKIDKVLNKVADELAYLYENEINLQFADIFEAADKFVRGQEAEGVKAETEDMKALRRLKLVQKEIRTMEKVKDPEDVVLRERRIKTLDSKLDEAQDEINSIINRYEIEDYNDKAFTDKNGKKWTIGDAKISEIEKNTNLHYFKNPLLSVLYNNLEMEKVIEAREFVEKWKNNPEFAKFGMKEGTGNPPLGWKTTSLVQFKGYHFEPRVADALNYFDSKMRGGDMGGLEYFGALNKLFRDSIFVFPFWHIPNLSWHAFHERGGTAWVTPSGWGSLIKTTMKAWDEVTNMTPSYFEHMEAGANFLWRRSTGQNVHDLFAEKVMQEMESNMSLLKKLSGAVGESPLNLLATMTKFSRHVTWFSHDFLYIRALIEREMQGMSKEAAIAKVRKHIPDYVIPSRILDQGWITEVMKNPNISMFGSYHYGMLKAWQDTFKLSAQGIMGDKGALKEAADKWLAFGISSLVVYPAIDKFLQWIYNDPDAHARRAGGATLVDNLIKKVKGQESWSQLAQSIVTPAIGSKWITEEAFNRNLWTGEQMRQPDQELSDLTKNFLKNFAPIQYGQQLVEGKRTFIQEASQMLGVSFTDPNVAKLYIREKAKGPKEKELGKLALTDPEKAKKEMAEFNEHQKNILDEVIKEREKKTGKKIPAADRKATLQKLQISNLRGYKDVAHPMTTEQILKKKKADKKIKARKNTSRTPEQESMIDKIMGFFQ